MCLIWPGWGSRLQFVGLTPDIQSHEICYESTTPFSSSTEVTQWSQSVDCTLLVTTLLHYYMFTFTSNVVDEESRLGSSEDPKLEEVGGTSRRRRDYRDSYHQLSSQRSTVQDGQTIFQLFFYPVITFQQPKCHPLLIIKNILLVLQIISTCPHHSKMIYWWEIMFKLHKNPVICTVSTSL